MKRRESSKAVTGTAIGAGLAKSKAAAQVPNADKTKAYLRSIMPSAKRVKQFTEVFTPQESLIKSNGWTYDAELGWVNCPAIHGSGINGSKAFYYYELDGARKVVNFPEKTARINTYGNSFTLCDQVNDGETWQEYLAAHLQESIRNYGAGGYSVYQAYRRMLRVEQHTSSEYIIFNIWDDDHFRNLDSWRSIRFGQGSQCGFTLPHLRVNVALNQCEQKENLIQKPEDVYKLCDESFLWENFNDDPVLRLVMAAGEGGEISRRLKNPVAVSFGIPEEKTVDTDTARQIRKTNTEAALFATKNVIGWVEQFVEKTGKKLMLILSFSDDNIANELKGKERFDQSLVDWLKAKKYPVIDMRDAFAVDYKNFKGSIDEYLSGYYIGHHTPRGNFFTAWAIKNAITRWLDPAPSPYH